MSDYELPEEAVYVLVKLDVVEGRAEGIREEIAQQAEAAREMFERQRADIDRDRAIVDALIKDRLSAYEQIAEVWADYELARADVVARFLEYKPRPAEKAAETLREKAREMAELRRRAKAAEYRARLYEGHFPWLTDLLDVGEAESYVAEAETAAETDERREDPVSGWLSPEEYRALPSAERNQRALDRYLRSRKTPWQLGRDYERYIGYLREQAGCKVTYHGIFQGLEDLGRDVLAEKDGQLEVIQCKRWAQAKTIHKKHVFQLYGTVVLAQLEQSEHEVRGTFTTTTQLSEKAREVAEFLKITVEEGVPLTDYPRIKCNVTASGERIYHLPMDQQYDKTVIEPERGECYATTVAEAEELGFRRAWRWRGG